LDVQFSSAGSGDADGQIVSYQWDFGNGNSATEASPWYSYQSAGNYTAVLTVTDDSGDTHTDTVAITVTSILPPVDTLPAAPTNLTKAVVKTGKGKKKVITDVTLNWTDNSDNETGFVVERCLEQTTGKGKKKVTTCDFTAYITTGANTTSQSVATESGYRYRVKAINDIGSSNYTNDVLI
jgi:PKD repeat protein